MKQTILITGVVAGILLVPAQSMAMDFKFSGQVNSALVFGGDVKDPIIVDNNTSGTRLRIKGTQNINDDIKAGFRYELQAQDNSSDDLTDKVIREVRYSDVWFAGSFGKIGLGKGDGAANNTFEAYSLINFLGGGLSELLFRGSTAVGYRTKDGISRQNRVRYDSPNFNGLNFALSLDNADTNEVAVRYKGKVADGKLDARLGLVSRTEDRTSYSVAYKHSSGVSASYSFGEDNKAAGDDDTNWIMLGYDVAKNITLAYGLGEESGGDEMNMASVDWKPIKGIEIYFNMMDFENANGVSGDAMALGSRIKF